MVSPSRSAVPELDLQLLHGFRFRCLPGCGLCCYATPAASSTEIRRLLQIDTEIPLVPAGEGYSLVASRPDGGACHFLQDSRCRVHSARPFPCREFPITVHLGDRVQAALVFSCPGIVIQDLESFGRPADLPPEGLDREIESVRGELAGRPIGKWLAENGRRRRRLERRLGRQGMWSRPWEDSRTRLVGRTGLPPADGFLAYPPPEADQPLENLPLFWDEEMGRVAFRAHPGGWEFFSLQERGGVGRHFGVLPPPDRCPAVTPAGMRLYLGYLRYALARDQFYWSLLDDFAGENPPDLSVEEAALEQLEQLGVQVLTRGVLRARLRQRPWDALDAEQVAWGIQSVDSEILDAPTQGRVL